MTNRPTYSHLTPIVISLGRLKISLWRVYHCNEWILFSYITQKGYVSAKVGLVFNIRFLVVEPLGYYCLRETMISYTKTGRCRKSISLAPIFLYTGYPYGQCLTVGLNTQPLRYRFSISRFSKLEKAWHQLGTISRSLGYIPSDGGEQAALASAAEPPAIQITDVLIELQVSVTRALELSRAF